MTSTIKVDNIQDQDGNNIINESSNTITVGASGDTIIIPSGATITNNGTQNGFGRTGTVDWQTGSIKTATFTAANGEGYFANTSGGAFTMNLPAGTAGNIVSVVDYTNTFDSNALTITPNGSQKIGGLSSSTELSTQGQSVTFVYVDDTEGWKNVQDSTSNVIGGTFITATGGTITTSGNYKIHTFTGPGTFTVCSLSNTPANNEVSYIVVAGGGSGQTKNNRAPSPQRYAQGGGGAGGFRESKSGVDCYSASPLEGATPITVTATGFPITVGGGGSAPAIPHTCTTSSPGSNSVFSTITSAGGGGAGFNSVNDPTSAAGANGGSGGAGGRCKSVGTGNTPPVSPPQGSNGGSSTAAQDTAGGGGGGATAAGGAGAGTGSPRTNTGGAGGAGATTSITGSPVAYAGGGGGAAGFPGACASGTFNPGAGGAGGGGAGGASPSNGTAGTANTGGGGGGAGGDGSAGTCTGGGGGSGVVIIRYKFQ